MDEIQAKLELLEHQLNPRAWLAELQGKAPLLGPALGLMTGIALQHTLALPQITWIVLLVVVLGSWFILHRLDRLTLENMALLAVLSMGSLGGNLILHHTHRDPRHIAHLVQSEPRMLTLQGRVLTTPRRQVTDTGQETPRHRTQWTLSCHSLQSIDGWQPCNGRITVTLYDQFPELRRGDRIQLNGWLRALRVPTNPGQFDRAAYLQRQGIVAQVTIKSNLACDILSHAPTGSLVDLHQRLIDRAELLHDLGRPEPDDLGLSRALLLGRRDSLPSPLQIAFRKTGLLHLISLSGMHIGILATLAWSVGWMLRLLKPGKAWITAVSVLVFVLIVPPRSATLRTAIICWVFCLGQMLKRPSNSLNQLSLAATILLCIRPTQLFDVGWQLSFSCVLSILLFFPRFNSLGQRFLNHWLPPVTAWPLRGLYRLLRLIIALLCTGLSAWLGGAGILLFNFYTLTPLSPIWTLLALPWVYLLFSLGLIKMIAGLFSTTLCHGLAVPLMGLEQQLAHGVQSLAHHVSGHWVVGRISGVWVILYYVTLLLMLVPRHTYRRLKNIAIGVIWLTLLTLLTWSAYRNDHPIAPRITLLDVGHGQAVVVQQPNGATQLFDAGSLYNPAVGEHTINPFLNYCGIDHLDAVIVSHPDRDHLNGLSDVLCQTPATVIYTPAPFVERLSPYLQDCPSNKLPPIHTLPQHWSLGDDLYCTTLWPGQANLPSQDATDNNLSSVVRVSYAHHSLLLCSDIEQPAQKQLLYQSPHLDGEILLAPHHGSSGTLWPDFLEQIPHDTLIVSGSNPHALSDRTGVIRTCEVGAIEFQWVQTGASDLCFGTKTRTR